MAVKKGVKKTSNFKDFYEKVKVFYNDVVKEEFYDIYTHDVYVIAAPFLLMELFTFIMRSEVNYSNYLFISPILFTITWVLLFV